MYYSLPFLIHYLLLINTLLRYFFIVPLIILYLFIINAPTCIIHYLFSIHYLLLINTLLHYFLIIRTLPCTIHYLLKLPLINTLHLFLSIHLQLRYDLTPIGNISVVATESGLIPPTSIPVLIRELQASDK